jgi:hypothetical protein
MQSYVAQSYFPKSQPKPCAKKQKKQEAMSHIPLDSCF